MGIIFPELLEEAVFICEIAESAIGVNGVSENSIRTFQEEVLDTFSNNRPWGSHINWLFTYLRKVKGGLPSDDLVTRVNAFNTNVTAFHAEVAKVTTSFYVELYDQTWETYAFDDLLKKVTRLGKFPFDFEVYTNLLWLQGQDFPEFFKPELVQRWHKSLWNLYFPRSLPSVSGHEFTKVRLYFFRLAYNLLSALPFTVDLSEEAKKLQKRCYRLLKQVSRSDRDNLRSKIRCISSNVGEIQNLLKYYALTDWVAYFDKGLEALTPVKKALVDEVKIDRQKFVKSISNRKTTGDGGSI